MSAKIYFKGSEVLLTAVVLCISSCWAKVTNGPVLLRVEKNRAAVMWETDTGGVGKVEFAIDANSRAEATAEPIEIEYEVKQKDKEPEENMAYIYKLWLDNLKAGSEYEYTIEGDDNSYHFKTTPEKTDELTFAVYGDSRSDVGRHKQVFKLLVSGKPDFIIHTGDAVADGDEYAQWSQQYFDVVKGVAESIPVYMAKGNHDGTSGNYEKLFIPDGEKKSYSFDYGPAHFFVGDNCTTDKKELLDLLAADAEKSDAAWKFAVWHNPSVNFGGHWSRWGQPEVMGVLAKAGIDFVFSGHYINMSDSARLPRLMERRVHLSPL